MDVFINFFFITSKNGQNSLKFARIIRINEVKHNYNLLPFFSHWPLVFGLELPKYIILKCFYNFVQ